MQNRSIADWDRLRYVLALARQGTLSGAAETLGTTHTTVARQIRALEATIGSRVFDQHSDGFVLTAVGEAIRAVAEEVEEAMHRLDRELLGSDTQLKGPLRVTTLGVVVQWFADAFRTFVETYPGIDLEITSSRTFENLTKREADIALRATNQPPEQLVGRKVTRFEYAVFGARSLVGSPPQPPLEEDFSSLEAYPWITWEQRLRARATEQWMAEHVPNARIAMRTDSPIVMNANVAAGAGLALIPCIAAQPHLDLIQLSSIIPDFGLDLWILTHPDLKHTARVRAFMRHMASAIDDP